MDIAQVDRNTFNWTATSSTCLTYPSATSLLTRANKTNCQPTPRIHVPTRLRVVFCPLVFVVSVVFLVVSFAPINMIHVKITRRASLDCRTWNLMPYWVVRHDLKVENVALLEQLNLVELAASIQTDMNGLVLFSQQIPRDVCSEPKNTAVQMCWGHSPAAVSVDE